MSNEKRSIVDSTNQKTVTIEVAEQDLIELKQGGYNLCFARKVNSVYDVAWQSYSNFLFTNTLSWSPLYQIFVTNDFTPNAAVEMMSNMADITFGETSVLNDQGLIGPPITGGPSSAITLTNEYGAIHPALSQFLTRIDGVPAVAPIYVSQEASMPGEAELTPADFLLVWFQQNIESGTMFSASQSMSVEIDMTDSNAATRLYQNGQWVTP